MKRLLTSMVTVLALLTSVSFADSPTRPRKKRIRHARPVKVEPPLAAVLLPAVHPEETRTFNNGGRPEARLATAATVRYINKNDGGNLNPFGINKFAAADMRRFGQDTFVFTEKSAHKFGVKWNVKPGWSEADRAREAKFKSDCANLLIEAINQEGKHRAGG